MEAIITMRLTSLQDIQNLKSEMLLWLFGLSYPVIFFGIFYLSLCTWYNVLYATWC